MSDDTSRGCARQENGALPDALTPPLPPEQDGADGPRTRVPADVQRAVQIKDRGRMTTDQLVGRKPEGAPC